MSPLVEMQATAPHTLTIRITPRPLLPGMGIRISYERVPHHYPARLDMLDSPVRLMLYPAVSPVIQKLENLPRGKYIVCGESLLEQGGTETVVQRDCFKIDIERLDNHKLQTGVVLLIILSIIIVTAAVLFSLLHTLRRHCVWRHTKCVYTTKL